MTHACPICGTESPRLLHDDRLALYRCPGCTVHFRLPIEATSHGDHFTDLDMGAYNNSVKAIRETTYPSLVSTVKTYVPEGTWLDVGCSFGWLLPFVHGAGYATYGIDPSASAVTSLSGSPYHITLGAYPAQDGGASPYEVMSFIEVVEHLPDPVTALTHARQDLKPGGVLVVSLPDQDCLLYPLSMSMFRASGGRARMPLERLYLEGFDFPHLFYFNARSMNALLDKAGFRVLKQERIPAGRVRDTWNRITYVEGRSLTAVPLAGVTATLMAVEQAAGYGGTLRTFATPK
jgi:SAM-dependent methyltransferase